MSRHWAVIAAGFSYFAIVFTLAFAMGMARVLLVAPRLGQTSAVFLEIPVLLTASWLVARQLIRLRAFAFPQLVVIGGIAFALTMIAEAVLAGSIRGQSVDQWAGDLTTPLGLVGLAAQLGFASIPVFAGGDKRRDRSGTP
ncbi:MAG: hypothetical protein QOJ91_2950 [Sphingomonadales bacterium]|nr:hypothetical protein [Sphingomonadales bacterium]